MDIFLFLSSQCHERYAYVSGITTVFFVSSPLDLTGPVGGGSVVTTSGHCLCVCLWVGTGDDGG